VGGIVILGEDITERLHSELQIERLNRIQSVLSGINQTIVRVRDSPAMLSAACSIAIDKGKFRMAWVGMLDDAGEEVNPITHCGEVDGYLDRLRIRVRGDNVAIGPAGRCILTGEHTVSNDIETDSIFAPWREDALHRGYRSMAVFPLILHGKTVGVFALYSSEPHFFDEEETKLLDQLAMDVSFALEVNEDDLKRQKVEEELRWSTAFFQAQLESSFDGILVKDETGRVLYRNERFLQLWGLPEDAANETDGGKLFQLMVQMGKDPGRLTRDTDRLTARRDEVSETEIELLDGTILNRLTSPVKDASGRYYGRIWVYHDMTKRRRLEHQLRQSQKMVALGQLTGGIAHDFNNLLAIILGNIDLMKPMLAENEPALHRLGILEKAAERGADMTRRLLAFSSNLELKPAPTRLADSVHNVIELARTVGPDIRFAPCLDESIPPIMVDAPGLENAMLNLVVNGRDAMPNGGTLTIATGLRSLEDDFPLVQAGDLKAQTYACISVSDTGCGMPKETVERAFEPFFTTTAQDRGTGLGLSMVYGFVKQSGGAVRIESEVGFGTTVSIFLPLGNAVPQPAAAVETTSDLAEKRTVLVVDDEPELVAILMTHLTRLGYRAFQAENGASALAIAQERTDLDLIITDIIMPGGMNGVELAVKVRELHPNIRVVYSSGYPADAMADRGLTPIDGIVLGKPYRAREFEKAIRESLA
jgi:PAS domain S-box-containing protein